MLIDRSITGYENGGLKVLEKIRNGDLKSKAGEEGLFPGWECGYEGLDLGGRVQGWGKIPLDIVPMDLQRLGKYGDINGGSSGWQRLTAA